MFWFRNGRTKQNEWEEFESEVLPCLAKIYRVAYWLTRDRAEAEDLVQETSFQALKYFRTYQKGTNIQAWLIKIMYRLNAKNQTKRKQLEITDEFDEAIVENTPYVPPVLEKITDEEILQALERIPANYSETVLLIDVQEFTYQEAADLLGIPLGTVMSRLHRARKILRFGLADYAESYGYNRRKN